MELEEFKEMIEGFVSDNFEAEGCKECHEAGHTIVPIETIFRKKGKETDYDKAVKSLYKDYVSKK